MDEIPIAAMLALKDAPRMAEKPSAADEGYRALKLQGRRRDPRCRARARGSARRWAIKSALVVDPNMSLLAKTRSPL